MTSESKLGLRASANGIRVQFNGGGFVRYDDPQTALRKIEQFLLKHWDAQPLTALKPKRQTRVRSRR